VDDGRWWSENGAGQHVARETGGIGASGEGPDSERENGKQDTPWQTSAPGPSARAGTELNIAQHVEIRPDLCALCLVSRGFRTAAERVLYRALDTSELKHNLAMSGLG
jgi:hypothetical protein